MFGRLSEAAAVTAMCHCYVQVGTHATNSTSSASPVSVCAVEGAGLLRHVRTLAAHAQLVLLLRHDVARRHDVLHQVRLAGRLQVFVAPHAPHRTLQLLLVHPEDVLQYKHAGFER